MKYDVVIVPTFAQVESWRKLVAKKAQGGLFAQTVTTFDALIADLWELYGDGRLLVDSALREALMSVITDCFARERTCDMVGIAQAASRCVRQASGVEAFEDAVESARAGKRLRSVSDRENDLLCLIARYEDELHRRGLVELGEAAAFLAAKSTCVRENRKRALVAETGSLTWIQEQFFTQYAKFDTTIDSAEGGLGIERAPEGVDVQFAFPSGRLAQPGLIADAIAEKQKGGSVVITCKKPLEMFNSLEKRLAGCGFLMRAQATKPFALTDFGRAYLALHQVLREELWNPASLADVAASHFVGLSRYDALRVDEMLRNNRIAERDESIRQISAESELFSQLVTLASSLQPDSDELISVFERRVQAMAESSEAWRAEQLSALRKLRQVMNAARLANAGIDVCADLLGRASVPVAIQVGQEGDEVLVTTQQVAASLPAGYSALAIIADLTSQDYPIAEKDDAISTFFSSLGLTTSESAIDRARREFTALLKLPTQRLILSRPLGDDEADETYPAVVLEEFVDAYRDNPSDSSDIDNSYRLPEQLRKNVLVRGEELLYSNAHADSPDVAQSMPVQVARPLIDDVVANVRTEVAPKRFDSEGKPIDGLCPSPSQIEAYLECPFQWFTNRRLHAEALGEGFGPLEKGSFAHSALEMFYRRFQETGYVKVTEDNLAEAQDVMHDVTRELSAQQRYLEPGSGRLVAANEIERRDIAALCGQLVNYLDFEAKLLPTFHPAHFEYEIDADHAVEYAGHHLVGTVDRIDVDGNGHAVIIDYKGSINAEHEIAGKVEGHCGKVQTRIYAQAVKRMLGLDVVAALYVSYGNNPAIAGAYDPRVIEAAHLPGIRADKCSCGSFEEVPDVPPDDYSLASLTFTAMLNETEAIVGRALEEMKQGAITPQPAYSKVCAYCPVLACAKREE